MSRLIIRALEIVMKGMLRYSATVPPKGESWSTNETSISASLIAPGVCLRKISDCFCM